MLKKNKFISISVILGVAMVAWQLFLGPLAYQFQQLFFICAIFVFGIPHGALDHLIDQEVAKRKENSFSMKSFSIKYWMLIIAYALLWYFFPQVSLLAFLLISSWHFGETDFQDIKKWPLVTIFIRLVYGVTIIIWILFAHTTEAGKTIMEIIPASSLIFKGWVKGVAHVHLLLAGAAIIITTALIVNQIVKQTKDGLWLILQLAVILICCYILPLLPAFALYFAGWHSVITLFNIEGFIDGKPVVNKPFSIIHLWLKALPFSLVALSLLLLTGYLLHYYKPLFNPLPLLFIFLSLITLPHLRVMNKLGRQL